MSSSELRRDPILRRWVIIAPRRIGDLDVRRPDPSPVGGRDTCPFCPGNEHLNPVEIAAARDGDDWVVRVTPDREPLLRIEGDLGRRGNGMFDLMNALGAHELVTDTPDHERSWADFPLAQIVRLLAMYRARINDLRRDPRFRYVLVLKNHGAVWSRYQHAHSHLIATPFTPKRLEEELAGVRDYQRMRERCVFCDQVHEELAADARVVNHDGGFLVFAPFASAHPYEMWVSPVRHAADFGTLDDTGLEQLAALIVDALGRLRATLGDVAYSVALHPGPLNGDSEFHWHWEIAPHLGQVRGMEWATGLISNPIPPEDAARQLRDARPG